jgi:hypothetical protein
VSSSLAMQGVPRSPCARGVQTDELWARLEPLIPVCPRRFRHPGRKRADDRAALEGILYEVRTGVGWNRLPTALFGTSGAVTSIWPASASSRFSRIATATPTRTCPGNPRPLSPPSPTTTAADHITRVRTAPTFGRFRASDYPASGQCLSALLGILCGSRNATPHDHALWSVA